MELDPDIHIVMHSVLSFKTGCDRTSEMGGKGVQWQPATTAMKTPEHGSLRETDRAVTTCHLPHYSVGWNTTQGNYKA
jgi:hypothetical protein